MEKEYKESNLAIFELEKLKIYCMGLLESYYYFPANKILERIDFQIKQMEEKKNEQFKEN